MGVKMGYRRTIKPKNKKTKYTINNELKAIRKKISKVMEEM